MKRGIKFLFDLDGTLTKEETLPLIAKYFGLKEEISLLTSETLSGVIPFEESLTRRVKLLGHLPINEINSLIEKVCLNESIIKFIYKHQKKCAIATGNLDIWISGLVKKFKCDCHSSQGLVCENATQLLSILRKQDVVKHYQNLGFKVIFIGDSFNDIPAMQCADISIAVGIIHPLIDEVLSSADYHVYEETKLLELLNMLVSYNRRIL